MSILSYLLSNPHNIIIFASISSPILSSFYSSISKIDINATILDGGSTSLPILAPNIRNYFYIMFGPPFEKNILYVQSYLVLILPILL